MRDTYQIFKMKLKQEIFLLKLELNIEIILIKNEIGIKNRNLSMEHNII